MNKTLQNQSVNIKSFLLDKLEGLPSKEQVIPLIQKFYRDNQVAIDTTATLSSYGVNSISNNYYLNAYIENVKIAKKLLYRIHEFTHKIKTLYDDKNTNSLLCTQKDFMETIKIIENRIKVNSDMSKISKLLRKTSPEWYFQEISTDIQLLGTLLNMLNMDFNIFNHAYTFGNAKNLDECKQSPKIETDTSYAEDIKSSYKYCVDGVCSVFKPYFSRRQTQKLKKGSSRRQSRKRKKN